MGKVIDFIDKDFYKKSEELKKINKELFTETDIVTDFTEEDLTIEGTLIEREYRSKFLKDYYGTNSEE